MQMVIIKFLSTYNLTIFVELIGVVESVKGASDIYSPISGKVESINEQLKFKPSLLNKSPTSEG